MRLAVKKWHRRALVYNRLLHKKSFEFAHLYRLRFKKHLDKFDSMVARL